SCARHPAGRGQALSRNQRSAAPRWRSLGPPMFGHRTVRILSIDGGGIRGIIPALILSRIQKRLDDAEVRKPYPELFDLIAGTSTGGIIALGLAVPKHESLQHSKTDEKSHARSSKKRVPQLDIYRIAEEYRI